MVWLLWCGCCGVVVVVWLLWCGRCGVVVLVWVLWFGCCGVVVWFLQCGFFVVSAYVCVSLSHFNIHISGQVCVCTV